MRSFASRYKKKKQFCDVLSYQKFHKLQTIQEKQLKKKMEMLKEVVLKKEQEISLQEHVLSDQTVEAMYEEFSEEEDFSDEELGEEEAEESVDEEEDAIADEECLEEEDFDECCEEEAESDEDDVDGIFMTGSEDEEIETVVEDDIQYIDNIDEGNFREHAPSEEFRGDSKEIKMNFEHIGEKVPKVTGLVEYFSTDDEFSASDAGENLHEADIENNGNLVFENLNEAPNIEEEMNISVMDDEDVEALMAMQFRDTRLQSHIREHNLNLVPREATRNDGNCWYDAIADQIVLHDVRDKPTNHSDLRLAVCDAIPELPQAKEWVQNIFGSEETFTDFIEKHRSLGVWTDELGVMCQATALFVGRNVHIVGTANIGQGFAFTKLESIEEADNFPPFTVGYYQDRHYQSLQELRQSDGENDNIHEESVDSGQGRKLFDEEKLLNESVFEDDSEFGGLCGVDEDIDSFDNNFINSDDSVSEMLKKVDKVRHKDDNVVDATADKLTYGKSRNLLNRLC